MFKNNWARWGFGSQLKTFDPSLPFVMDFSGAGPTTRAPLELAQEAAWAIHEAATEPLTIMISGGIDSQATAYAFKTAGVPARFVRARFTGGWNDHDFLTKPFYDQHGIDVEHIDLDIVAFHEFELREWASQYANHSPHFLAHLKIASMLDGHIISSGCLAAKIGKTVFGLVNYSGFALYRYAQASQKNITGYFLNYDPAFVYSVANIGSQLSEGAFYETKCALYQACGFPVLPQEKKLHGFEHLKDHYDRLHVPPTERMKYMHLPSKRPYDIVFRYGLRQLINYSDDAVLILPKLPR